MDIQSTNMSEGFVLHHCGCDNLAITLVQILSSQSLASWMQLAYHID